VRVPGIAGLVGGLGQTIEPISPVVAVVGQSEFRNDWPPRCVGSRDWDRWLRTPTRRVWARRRSAAHENARTVRR
jgi:hypothetical protein